MFLYNLEHCCIKEEFSVVWLVKKVKESDSGEFYPSIICMLSQGNEREVLQFSTRLFVVMSFINQLYSFLFILMLQIVV